jgi:hypothetical protein
MLWSVDIFRVDPKDGSPCWIENARTLDAANERVKELMNSNACEYVIFDHATQSRTSVKPEDDDRPSYYRGDDHHSE